MKKFYLLLVTFFVAGQINAQIVTIPDTNFKAKLLLASTANQIAKDATGNYIKIDANSDSEIQETEAQNVRYLDVSGSTIASLQGIQSFTNLQYLLCNNNQLTSLNVNGLAMIKTIKCFNNQLTSLNITGLTTLQYLDCSNNQLPALTLTGSTTLVNVFCGNNQLTALSLTGLTNIQQLDCSNNDITSLNLTGLVNVTHLKCYGNQIAALGVSAMTNLKLLYCSNNQLGALNVSGLTQLEELYANYNGLTALSVTGLTALKQLECSNNQLTALNVTGLTNLETLKCSYNQLSALNASGLLNLKYLYLSNNQATTLNTLASIGIKHIDCAYNQFTALDFSLLPSLVWLKADHNTFLVQMLLKNGSNETLNFSDNPNLTYICVDNAQLASVQTLITQYGYVNCEVNSYCSFTPGGTYYTLQGVNRYDSNTNGCDTADLPASNLKMTVSSGTSSGSWVSGPFGTYIIPVQAGIHTLTPVLEYPSYFTVSPTSVNVNFPTQASPFTQNFCLTANGSHPDLEVNLYPVSAARPGFDSYYRLTYKNKGTMAQSGTVRFTFDDAVLDYVSATPNPTGQIVNELTWNFTNLQPFETKVITFILNVNSTLETPPVNVGDILPYVATVESVATDATPTNNTFALNQTVVNSFDPNDKTCLEGAKIAPSMVGEYVHYMIRFENTGNYPAENIVVKDMIDTSKFDMATLTPLDASHDFATRITEGNKVEFIFQNINLPFEDATNDGFVAFKIKTKPTLVVGNTFTNSASIYFDYNAPIVTNTASTLIQTLGNQEFDLSRYITLYPNPAKDVLNINAKSDITISSIQVYNTLGQLVIVIPSAQGVEAINVSSLKTGNYFIKIVSDKGVANTQFIKE